MAPIEHVRQWARERKYRALFLSEFARDYKEAWIAGELFQHDSGARVHFIVTLSSGAVRIADYCVRAPLALGAMGESDSVRAMIANA